MKTLIRIAKALLELPTDTLISLHRTIGHIVGGGRPLISVLMITDGLLYGHVPRYTLGMLLMLMHIAVKVEDYKVLEEDLNDNAEDQDHA